MPANLAIDDDLLEEAVRIGGYQTKKDTVHAALREFVSRRQQREIVKLFGAVEYDPQYDYKRGRRRGGK